MKKQNHYRSRGRHLSLALIAFILAAILLWDWEKIPFGTTEQLADDQFLPSSEFPPVTMNIEAGEDHVEEESSNSVMTEETKNPEENYSDALPMNFATAYPPEREDSDVDRSFSPEAGVCNYAKGRWVADGRFPFYSGLQCRKWLSKMWACRHTVRTDFSYEQYRWQPKDCSMPEFERSAFLKRMQDKTIAFIGDSLGRQQFQSLMCMVTGGEIIPEVEDVGWDYDLILRPGAIRPDGWAYRFPDTNTTILFYWSATLCELERINSTDPDSVVAMHLDRPVPFLQRFIHRFDVLVLNTAQHWNKGKQRLNHWVLHVDGKPDEDAEVRGLHNARNFTVYSIVRWVDSLLPSHPQLKAFFRTRSPRHFRNGEWNSGGVCNNTIPMTRGSEVLQDGSSDPVVENAIKGTGVKILDITALSELRDEGHKGYYGVMGPRNGYDCLHWCLPGIPDTWNEILIAQL